LPGLSTKKGAERGGGGHKHWGGKRVKVGEGKVKSPSVNYESAGPKIGKKENFCTALFKTREDPGSKAKTSQVN